MSIVNLSRPKVFPSLNPFWGNFLDDSHNLSSVSYKKLFMPAVNFSEDDQKYNLEVVSPELTNFFCL